MPGLLLAALVCAAPVPEAPKAPPRLRVHPAGRQDLGSVGPAERRILSFAFTNTSPNPIRLHALTLPPEVRAEGPALEEAIPSGASRNLQVKVDASGLVGWQARTLRFQTDDPGQGLYQIPLAMTVRPDLTVDRERASFGEVAPHESPELVFSFARETGESTTLSPEGPLPPYLEAECDSGPRPALRLSLHPSRIPPGQLQGLESVALSTTAPLQPRFRIYVDWRLAHPLKAEPERMVFRDPQSDRMRLSLSARDGRPFRIRAAHIEGGGFSLGPLPGHAAPRLELDVRRSPTPAGPALLLVEMEGEAAPLKVPLAYAPEGRP